MQVSPCLQSGRQAGKLLGRLRRYVIVTGRKGKGAAVYAIINVMGWQACPGKGNEKNHAPQAAARQQASPSSFFPPTSSRSFLCNSGKERGRRSFREVKAEVVMRACVQKNRSFSLAALVVLCCSRDDAEALFHAARQDASTESECAAYHAMPSLFLCKSKIFLFAFWYYRYE